MNIIMCDHESAEKIFLTVKSYFGENKVRSLDYGDYCPGCADNLRSTNSVLHDREEEINWLKDEQ